MTCLGQGGSQGGRGIQDQLHVETSQRLKVFSSKTPDSHVSVGLEGTGLWEQPMEDPVSVGDLGVENAEPRVR